ncbi:helix-turn-helix transcriptional regulator [Chryseobacterium hagamense]|uniref:HTH cro/C1-type domain-containing protein n=1 Tax=Chryseobacterium hagamense TaxID=395935 RepID=A0A511YJR9_9FLAO|nr:helix-turn-helix transcriptional regulator [Chryseobacterium hagamense]GEN75447.1 hypothetical protein CHA01nite_11870 [Chryseobacterium hagamense]
MLKLILYENWSNISESTYRRYEADKSFPDIFLLCRIAKIFDKKLNNLLPEYMVDVNENSSAENSNITKYLSEKIIEQYEERLKDKDCQIALLKSMLEKYSSI